MAITTPHTWIAGDDATSTYLQTMSSGITELQAPNLTVMVQAAAQSIPDSTFTSINFASPGDEAVDRGSQHGAALSRFVAVLAGWYQVDAGVSFASNATGRRLIQLTVSGTAYDGSQRSLPAVTTGITTLGVSKKVYMTVGQYLEVQGYQSSGGALNTSVSGAASSHLDVAYYST